MASNSCTAAAGWYVSVQMQVPSLLWHVASLAPMLEGSLMTLLKVGVVLKTCPVAPLLAALKAVRRVSSAALYAAMSLRSCLSLVSSWLVKAGALSNAGEGVSVSPFPFYHVSAGKDVRGTVNSTNFFKPSSNRRSSSSK